MPRRPFLLSELTYPDVLNSAFEVAVLPWGATEAHNTHLPYGTDSIETEAIAIAAADEAWRRGARVLVLPTVPYGVNTGQRDVPFCLNMMPSTQTAVIGDLLVSLERHGIRKVVILNGHGGNDFRQIIRELQPRTRMVLSQVNWYQAVPASRYFDVPGDHAGELETSVMMELAPDLVRPLDSAGPGTARPNRVAAFREGWAWTPRPWTQVTGDTGVGDPSESTRDKGAAYVAAVVDRLAGFLRELAEVEPDRMFGEPAGA
jgi:creatinine amidohydrolase